MATIIKATTWPFYREVHNDAEQLFNKGFNQPLSHSPIKEFSICVDILETPEKYIIAAELPGFAPKELEISVQNNILTLKGERTRKSLAEGLSYAISERNYGKFTRQFSLPNGIDISKINAKSKFGILEISIPKKETQLVQKIAVQVEEGS